MTRVAVVHNPGAGAGEFAADELRQLVEEAGYDAAYGSTRDGTYKKVLEDPGAFVIAAGGDGTVRRVAERLVGRGVPIAVLPLGTANNFAASLGISGEAREVLTDLSSARRMSFDVGVATGPWGRKLFFESFGVGLFAHVMSQLDRNEGNDATGLRSTADPLAGALRALRNALDEYVALDLHLALDGEARPGRYLMVEAMNVPFVGPRLFLAPDADPGDGALDFVLVEEERREEFHDYLRHRLDGRQDAPRLTVRRGQRLEIAWDGSVLRCDDEAWPTEKKRRNEREKAAAGGRSRPVAVQITVQQGGLEFLIPPEEG